MSSGEPVLSITDVHAGYGAIEALRGVDLSVDAGEVVGLVGPNGCGKTSLVRVASRTLPPTSGAVSVAGRDPYSLSGREAARLVAVVPQDVIPAFPFSVLEFVLMGRTPYISRWGAGSEDDWAKARDAMAAVGVQHLADRSMNDLSGESGGGRCSPRRSRKMRPSSCSMNPPHISTSGMSSSCIG